MKLYRSASGIFLTVFVVALAACGGGGGGAGSAAISTSTSLTVTGTAATGLAIAGATVTGKCKVGTGTATTLANGTFTLTVTDGQLPCVLQVTNPADGTKLHTLVSGTAATAVANITPLTEMTTARVLGSEPNVFFAAFDAAAASQKVTTANIASAQTVIGLVFTGTIDLTGIANFITTPLVAATQGSPTSGDAQDKLLDALKLKLTKAQLGTVTTALANSQTADAIKQTVISLTTVPTTPPVANSGVAQSVVAGSTVTLDASTSSAATGKTLTYVWTLTSKPAGSAATLAAPTTVKPTFVADVAGSYVASVIVNDGTTASSAAAVTITASVSNAAPVATAGVAQNVATGSAVTLDGSASSDANGDTLTYVWTLTAKPAGSTASLSSTNSVKPTFTADVSGTYVASLTVNDGEASSQQSNVAIEASTAAFGFAANSTVKVFLVDKSSGALTSAGTAQADNAPRSVVLHPNGRYLYVSDLDANTVTVFSISKSTGALSKLFRVTADSSPGNTIKVIDLQIDPLGRILYVATHRTNNITSAFSTAVSTLAINTQTGALTSLSSTTTSTNNWSVTPHPSGKFLYVPSYNNSNIAVYQVDAPTGVMTGTGSIVTEDGPAHMIFDATGRYGYCAINNANKVSAYSVDQTTGALSLIESQSTGTAAAAGGNPLWLALHPSGKFLYTANYANGNITTFIPDAATGALGVAVKTTISNGSWPGTTYLAIDSSGKHLYAVAGFNATTTIFSIDQVTGVLSEVGRISGGGRLALTPLLP